jgi:hypothetical protein
LGWLGAAGGCAGGSAAVEALSPTSLA